MTPPAFEYRSWEICNDLEGFCYPVRKYGKCLDKFLWMCRKREEIMEVEVVPFTDKVGMKKFQDASFVLMRHPMN